MAGLPADLALLRPLPGPARHLRPGGAAADPRLRQPRPPLGGPARLFPLASPQDAAVLVAGCGTGAELLEADAQRPDWQLTAIDPSAEMLAVARQRLQNRGRIEWHHATVEQLGAEARFDGALSVLVLQSLPDDGTKLAFLSALARSLRPQGQLVLVDLMRPERSPSRPRWRRPGAASSGPAGWMAKPWISPPRSRGSIPSASPGSRPWRRPPASAIRRRSSRPWTSRASCYSDGPEATIPGLLLAGEQRPVHDHTGQGHQQGQQTQQDAAEGTEGLIEEQGRRIFRAGPGASAAAGVASGSGGAGRGVRGSGLSGSPLDSASPPSRMGLSPAGMAPGVARPGRLAGEARAALVPRWEPERDGERSGRT